MDLNAVIARIHEHLEEDHVESAVMACLRVARAAKDHVHAAIFLRELYPDKNEVVRALYDDIAPLKREAQKYVFEFSLERWLELHTVELATPEEDFEKRAGDRRNVLKISAGELEADIQQSEKAIADLSLPTGMGEFDTAAFTDRFIAQKSEMRMRIRALLLLKSRLKVRCLNYAIQMERQLALQTKSQSFLESAQNEVNNFFKPRSEDVFNKLQKAAQLAVSADAEDCALLLTEVRRALKAAADYFYKPVAGHVRCKDGKERLMGEDQYLNRLNEFVAMRFVKATSVELLQAELDHLNSFVRRLNEMASKGVHGIVTFAEAKQGLIGLYFFLFNLCQHLTHDKEGLIAVAVTAEE
jgi:hypothetical protein